MMWVPLYSTNPSECPTLPATTYVGLGSSRDQKGGFIYPDIYGNFIIIFLLLGNKMP